jgi:MerR family transcriptional regulator, mercuric resistance operon regulatory protein
MTGAATSPSRCGERVKGGAWSAGTEAAPIRYVARDRRRRHRQQARHPVADRPYGDGQLFGQSHGGLDRAALGVVFTARPGRMPATEGVGQQPTLAREQSDGIRGLQEFSPRPLCGPPNGLASGENESTQKKPSVKVGRNDTERQHQYRRDHGEIIRPRVVAVGTSAAPCIQNARGSHPGERDDPDGGTVKVLPAPARAGNGRRTYGPTETRILGFIRRARELGFSLDEIRALLRLGGPGKTSCGEVREIAAHHLNDIHAKISDLRKLERLLSKTVAQCTGTAAPVCPVLDILDIQHSNQP